MLGQKGKRWAVTSALAVSVLIVGLFTPTLIGGWAPLLRWTCASTGEVMAETVQIPGLLLNSPYAGRAWGNVTYPLGFLPDDLIGQGTKESNGGAAWAGFLATVTVDTVGNETAWGPGANVHCSQPFGVTLSPIGNPSVGIPILGPGNLSDRDEPTVLFPGNSSGISFWNGFGLANSGNVTTCGDPALSLPLVTSTYLTLWASFSFGGQSHSASFSVPVVMSQFHYWFPANFGTWQVDNLSAPGGPGGGWAFSYSPCS